MIAVIAVILMTAGVAFIALATIGVIRFNDPLQRMHAATKAGTVGAALCLLAAAIVLGDADSIIVALFSILFLIATMPVAGHLLGRAAYISGAPLRTGRDALKGVLPRAKNSLDERSRAAFARAAEAAAAKTVAAKTDAAKSASAKSKAQPPRKR